MVKQTNTEKCECCGNVPVIGKRYSKGVDGGANLRVCQSCKNDTNWDLDWDLEVKI